ncbi:MAG: hypothetical protein ABI594_11155 [Ginsengibacter sp.]
MKKNKLIYFVVFSGLLIGCGKSNDTIPTGGNGGGNNGGGKDSTCMISTISQVNSGAVPEFYLSAYYNNNYQLTRLVSYDSVNKVQDFIADFNYITSDSVRIDSYQYLILDASKRVARFATKSDLAKPINADNYLFEYAYNNQGYLIKKDLYVNGTKSPNFSTVYVYTNNLLTSCVMTAVSSGNLKVLESILTYDNTIKIKNWIYTFPDAIEGYRYSTVLNFGNRCANPLKQIVTKIYNPSSGILLDTWTTSYGNYKTDASGHILYGEAIGDQQQGIAAFYGKTNFNYTCH